MLAVSVRSDLTETYHNGAVALCGPDGTLLAWAGDIDRPFYIRSSAKPFQARVSQDCGADLAPVQMAIACSSHRGHPVQVGMVAGMLAEKGLSESDLRCPADWPMSREAARRLANLGETEPRPLWHNCSGKHTGFLRACVASGWPTEGYLDPGHPLQRQVTGLLAEAGGHDPEPVGVDGCGAPVHRTTVRAMARMFAYLASDPGMADVRAAMHRYPALVGETGSADSELATHLDAVAKGGAQGCLGVGLASGMGVAVKSWDGSPVVPGVAAVAALGEMGLLSRLAGERLGRVARPAVRGGGQRVGEIRPAFDLEVS
jgi:L-asparaginase II